MKPMTNEEFVKAKKDVKKEAEGYTAIQLLDLYNAFSMGFVIHENDSKAQNNDLIWLGALQEMILERIPNSKEERPQTLAEFVYMREMCKEQ